MAPLPRIPPGSSSSPRFGAGLSGHLDPAIAAEQACDQALAQLGDRQNGVDLAFLFIADRHGASAPAIAERVRRGLGAGCLVGVTGCGIVGGEAELEDTPGVSILAASLPGVEVRPFRTDWLPAVNVGSETELAAMAQAAGMVGAEEGGHRATFLFADPFSVPMGALLPALGKAAKQQRGGGGSKAASEGGIGAPILGGMASAGRRPDTNVFILNDELSINGGVGVSLAGAIDVTAIVSQGCRPIGPPLVVTACKKQLLLGLAGRPALEVLAEIVASLSEHERDLLKTRGLFLGRAVSEYKERFGRGDFLIRNVIGIDKRAGIIAGAGEGRGGGGAIAVAELLRIGQTVQFHVRDERTADEDLALLLDGQKLHDPPLGSLLFTCNGRGKELFGAPHHDARAVTRAFAGAHAWPPLPAGESIAKAGTPIPTTPPTAPTLPLAGFFAAGEIGPIGGECFVHGQTACIALFRETR